MRWAAAALLACAATVSCTRVTQIVLVVDTDMTVPMDLDHLDITVAGAVESKELAVDLVGAPAFPLTLGLTPADGAWAVNVTVVGTVQGVRVVDQVARTMFVDGESRMLHLVLVKACVPVMCSTGLTCDNGGCVPADRPGTSLPTWTGTLPPRPDRPPPTPIQGRTVWSSGWHSAAVEDTALYGWGQNADGQIGNGNTQNANARRPVMNVQAPSSVGLGQLHSCICDRGGQALCWGRNVEGQLGTGDTSPSLTPVVVPGVNDCRQIAGGAAHTCVVRGDAGSVSCWGNNSDGQLGTAPGAAPVTSPVTVEGLTDVVQVQCGEKYSCARRKDGTVACWGDNAFGQLGDGTMTDRSSPTNVTGLAEIAEVAVGRFFACALGASGQVLCWGRGGGNVLGTPGGADSATPLEITGLTDAVQLAAGQAHACAIRKGGILSCWGGNGAGQLGNGTTTSSPTPVDVLDIEKVTSIAAGSVHTCARHSTGLACWGENIVNQLGDGSTTNRSRPVSVAGFL